MRVALYARISRDPEEQQAGVDRQLVRGRETAERNGWTVAATYIDNDASAYQGTRPGFEDLKAAIEAGEVEAVLVQHQDRLARNVTAFRGFADLCVRHDVRIETWSGPVDMSSAAGRFTSTIQAATDEHYSALISEKARAAHADIAARGEPNGGRRPFGYVRTVNDDGHRTFEPHPDEAPILADLFARFLSGASINGMSVELNERGIPTAGGSEWSTSRLRDILSNPIYAGHRVHRGEIVGRGNWPPLVSREDSETARAILEGRRRKPGHNVRRYYLSGGIARCGICGTPLVSRRLKRRRIYSCPPTTRGGCGGVGIDAEGLEDHAADLIIDVLKDPRIGEAIERRQGNGDAALLAELDQLEERRTDAAEAFALGEIDRGQLAAITQRLDERRDEVRSRLSPVTGPALTLGDLVELWESENVEWRHRVALALFDSVVVNPAVRGRNYYDPERVEFNWST